MTTLEDESKHTPSRPSYTSTVNPWKALFRGLMVQSARAW